MICLAFEGVHAQYLLSLWSAHPSQGYRSLHIEGTELSSKPDPEARSPVEEISFIGPVHSSGSQVLNNHLAVEDQCKLVVPETRAPTYSLKCA